MGTNALASINLAQELARSLGGENQYRWPYPWVHQPSNGIPVEKFGSVAAPAFGAANQVAVITYTVPQGFEFVLREIMHIYVGSNWFDGDGNIVWDIDVNRPITGGALLSGYPIPDFANMTARRGSLEKKWTLSANWRFQNGQTIRYKVRTVATVATGAPNFVHCALAGWIWPPRRR